MIIFTNILKKNLILAIWLLVFPISLFALPYDMILTGDPVLEDLRYLSLESGISILSFTAPFAPHEIEIFLDSIDQSTLSAPAAEAYNRIKTRLEPKTPLSLSWDNFSLFFNVDSTLEARTRFNTDIDWYPAIPKIPAMISLPLRFYFFNSVELYVDPAFSIDPHDYSANGYYADNLLFFRGNGINGNSPMRAFGAAGGPWWNFQIGRDRLSYGTGISGNLGIADNPPFYEYMRYSLFSKYFKYSFIVNHTPLKTEEIFQNEEEFVADTLKMTMHRYFYLHRADFKLFNVLSIGLMEGVMVGNSSLELRYLNPFLIYHNAMTWRDYDHWESSTHPGSGTFNGSFFNVEFNWNITKSLAAYGQFAMTELAIGPEVAEGRKVEPPNALGFMGGLQYSHSFKNWGSLFYLEFFYTNPYLYMNGSPYASIIYMHDVEFVYEKLYYYYFGYNRDTIAVNLGTKFFNKDWLIIGGELAFLCQGIHGDYPIIWDWERTEKSFNEKTPSGTPQNKYIANVSAQWKPYSFFSLNGNLTGIVSQNNKHESGVNKIGGQVSLSVSFHY